MCCTHSRGSLLLCAYSVFVLFAEASVCHGSGDPHFTTFDGVRIHFQGTCRYTLAKPCDGAMQPEDLFNVTVQQEHRRQKRSVAYIKSVYVEAYGVEVALLKDRQMKVCMPAIFVLRYRKTQLFLSFTDFAL